MKYMYRREWKRKARQNIKECGQVLASQTTLLISLGLMPSGLRYYN